MLAGDWTRMKRIAGRASNSKGIWHDSWTTVDPMIIRFSRHDLYRDFPCPFRCEPWIALIILDDPDPEIRMSLPDFGNRVSQHALGDSSLDPATIVTVEKGDRVKRRSIGVTFLS